MKQYQIVLGLITVLTVFAPDKLVFAAMATESAAVEAYLNQDVDFFTIGSVETQVIDESALLNVTNFEDPCDPRRVRDPEAPRDPNCDQPRTGANRNTPAKKKRPGTNDGRVVDNNPLPDETRPASSRNRRNDDRDLDEDTDTRDTRDTRRRRADDEECGTYDRDCREGRTSDRRRSDDYDDEDSDWIGGGRRTSGTGGLSDTLLDINEIINTALKIWKIIVDNRPVMNVKTDYANALPKGAKDWTDLENWNRIPKVKLYRVTYKNLYGVTVVDLTYRLKYTYGGNVDGKGHFLTNVTIDPSNLTVTWGFKFTATGKVPNVVNVGTRLDPVAQAEVNLDWKVESPLKGQQSQVVFVVRGDGTFSNLSGGT